MPRRPAGWHGSYRLPQAPELAPGECRVLDVSERGTGLELYGPWPRDGVDLEVLVKLTPPEHGTASLELKGVVRYCSVTKFGFRRVGVEFLGLSPAERAFLVDLTKRGVPTLDGRDAVPGGAAPVTVRAPRARRRSPPAG